MSSPAPPPRSTMRRTVRAPRDVASWLASPTCAALLQFLARVCASARGREVDYVAADVSESKAKYYSIKRDERSRYVLLHTYILVSDK